MLMVLKEILDQMVLMDRREHEERREAWEKLDLLEAVDFKVIQSSSHSVN